MDIKERNFLFNANVLIDFQKSDFSVLAKIRQQIGNLYLLEDVRAEVPGLTGNDCDLVGLRNISPPSRIKKMTKEPYHGLSREDRLILNTAIDFGFEIATNDTKLRRESERSGVKLIWGLQLLLEFVEKSEFSIDSAKIIGERIVARNLYMTEKILVEFVEKLENIRTNRT